MAAKKKGDTTPPRYSPTMTQDYSRISDTALAIASRVLPGITAYINSIASKIASMQPEMSFNIADYGAADGVNSSQMFEQIIGQLRSINPSLKIGLCYIDIADRSYFDEFWKSAGLAQLDFVTAAYIKRSFYEPFPELAGKLNIGFSSTSLHWLDTRTVDNDFFRNQTCIQANQLPDRERDKFVEKWKQDWRVFFRECWQQLVPGGALFLANLANLGGGNWPASPGYNHLRDICHELCHEGVISQEELNAVFIPDYFATPQEMRSLLNEDDLKQLYFLKSSDEMTVPCAYFKKLKDRLDTPQARADLAATLAHVVRAWSESSVRTGLSAQNKDKIEEIYKRLRNKFYEEPDGLPYQYCLLELVKRDNS